MYPPNRGKSKSRGTKPNILRLAIALGFLRQPNPHELACAVRALACFIRRDDDALRSLRKWHQPEIGMALGQLLDIAFQATLLGGKRD